MSDEESTSGKLAKVASLGIIGYIMGTVVLVLPFVLFLAWLRSIGVSPLVGLVFLILATTGLLLFVNQRYGSLLKSDG